MPHFTLTVATSSDGFIARAYDDPPHTWVSAEEQDLFFRDVEAADWSIMGRHTHKAADKPQRRRIVFSTKVSGWQRPTQFWLDPAQLDAAGDLTALVAKVYPLKNGLILGGTRVHDWFLAMNAIDRVHLTVEPVTFGRGLPIFTGETSVNPVQVFEKRGFRVLSHDVLNGRGTQYYVCKRP